MIGGCRFNEPAGRTGWVVVALVLSAWVALLAVGARLPPSGVAVVLVQAVAIGGLMRALAAEADRRPVTGFYLAGLLVFTAGALVAQTTPQWEYARFDTPLYDLNARALVMHWEGQPVPAAAFKLKGLVRLGVAQWQPDDTYAYGEALGMSRYVYQLYVAAIYTVTGGSMQTAIFGNLPFAAGVAAGTFLLARALFESQRAASLAAGLTVADPGLAVWSAILMRDVMIAFLMMLALLGSVRLWRRQKVWPNAALTGSALAVLALVRFNAVVALALAWLAVSLAAWRISIWRTLLAAAASGALIVGLLQTSPGLVQGWENSLPAHVLQENLRIFLGSKRVVEAATGTVPANPHEKIDNVRREWHANLREQPLWMNLARAVARTLLSPFPWVAFTHGLTGTNYYELLFPGMTLWLLCLPAFFYALWRAPGRGDSAVALCLVWLGTVALFYIIGYGQLDGRNRLMAQPLLWTFAAQGLLGLRAKWSERG